MIASIEEFGFRIPILAKSTGLVVDGHLRLKAARKLQLHEVPVIVSDDMTEVQIKAFRLIANKSATWADWNFELLAVELDDLRDEGFDLGLLGFDQQQLNDMIGTPNAGPPGDGEESADGDTYSVMVSCNDPAHQEQVYKALTKAGYSCKVIAA